jgi:Flp pilus assembly protein TadB
MLIGMLEFSAETGLAFEIAVETIKHKKAKTINERVKKRGIDLKFLLILKPPGFSREWFKAQDNLIFQNKSL